MCEINQEIIYVEMTKHDGLQVVEQSESADAFYPAAAYEALQKENEQLKDRITIMDEAAKYYNETIIGISNTLHAENEALKLKKEFIEYAAQDLENQNAAQAKRIAELEAQISSQMNFGERMIINSDGDVVGDDTGRVVAKFSHWNEAESFCEAANFKYSASKNGE